MNEFINKNISFRVVLLFVFGFWALALPITYFYFGPGPHSDIVTMLLGFSIATMMFVFMYNSERLNYLPVMSMLSYMVLLHFLPRIWQYLAVEQLGVYNLYILFPIHWSSDGINAGLIYVALATLSLGLGIVMASRLSRRLNVYKSINRQAIKRRVPSIISFMIAGAIIYSVDGFYTIYHGMSAAANCTQKQIPGVWLIHFFSGDIFIFAVMVLMGSRIKDLTPMQKVFLLTNIIIYLCYTMILGSRGGILRIFTISYCIFLAIGNTSNLSFKKLITTGPVVLILAVMVYVGGNTLRIARSANCSLTFEMFSSGALKESLSVNFDLYALSSGLVNDSSGTKKLKLPTSASRILDRLGLIDYPIGISLDIADPEAQKKYINYSYMAKNFMNNIVIGEPFPEAKYMTANVMPILYRGRDFQHISENFLTDAWTLWGTSYALFGFVGGVFSLFFVGFLVQSLFDQVSKHCPNNYRLPFRTYFLWIGMMGIILSQMSLDHAAILTVYATFQFTVTFLLIDGIDTLYCKFFNGMNKDSQEGI